MCKALFQDKIGNGNIGPLADKLTWQGEEDVEGGCNQIKNRAYYQYQAQYKVH